MTGALLLLGVAFAAPATDEIGECVEHGTWFVDVGDELGVRGFGNSLGVNFNDFDGDGRTDIFVGRGPARAEGAAYYPAENLLYLQQDDGTFVESGAQMGLDSVCEDRAPLRGDLDGDGLPDLYVTVNGMNAVYRNDSWAWYEDVTAWAGAAPHPGWGHQGVLADYDRDGWLDVFFSNGPEDGSSPSVLLRNQRDGTFRDQTEDAGIVSSSSGEGSCSLDFDGDGWVDIFVVNGRGHDNHLFMNQGDGTFVDEAVQRGVNDPLLRFSFATSCADLDNDGDPDILLITHDAMYTGNRVLENDGGFFADVALDFQEAGGENELRDRIDPHALAVVDLDNDGLLDIVMSGINFTPYVFLNQGGLRFHRACDGLGIAAEDLLSWAFVAGDINGDGYPDLYLSSGLGRRPSDDYLFRYEGDRENNWLGVSVKGLTHNRSALGATVEVEAGGQTLTRWVGTWSSFQSQGSDTLIFGLGPSDEADRVRVRFTNGTVVEQEFVPANQVIEVVEDRPWADEDADGVPDEWDVCSGTVVGRPTDGEGCAVGQRGGLAVAGVAPTSYGVVTDCFRFEWEGDVDQSAVVQVSGDGTFGVTRRIDLGPVVGGSLSVCGDELDELRTISDGSRPLIWRVAMASEDGREGLSLPKAFYLALPATDVQMPRGASVFNPAHIVVEQGTTVSWWNNSVNAGNLQNELHDVQLIDAFGSPVSDFRQLDGGAYATWTFNQPGIYHAICHQHSGTGSEGDEIRETTHFQHHRTDGPYRCMAGTVTVR